MQRQTIATVFEFDPHFLIRIELKYKERKIVHSIFIAPMNSHVTNVFVYNLYITSVASEQQHKQDLRRIYLLRSERSERAET